MRNSYQLRVVVLLSIMFALLIGITTTSLLAGIIVGFAGIVFWPPVLRMIAWTRDEIYWRGQSRRNRLP